jgi:hypothetical protein
MTFVQARSFDIIVPGIARPIHCFDSIPTGKMRKHLSLGLTVMAGLAVSASAHTVLTTLFVEDATQGEGTCVRMHLDPNQCTSPVGSVTSDDMACGESSRSGRTPRKSKLIPIKEPMVKSQLLSHVPLRQVESSPSSSENGLMPHNLVLWTRPIKVRSTVFQLLCIKQTECAKVVL